MSTELVTRDNLMPALSIQEAIDRYNAVVKFVQQVMKEGLDYGTIPGTDKPTLFKPGSEKLCTLFGFVPEFETVNSIVDFDRGLFYFHYRCRLTRHGATVATGEGSCNSKEKKYRYRFEERKCPNCGKATIIKGRAEYGGGFLCYGKKGGCGAKFTDNAPEIINQPLGQVENTEPFDLINTLQKMGQKRALVASVLIAANASEFFTQDVEDIETIEGVVVPDGISHGEIDPGPQKKPAPKATPVLDTARELGGVVTKVNGKPTKAEPPTPTHKPAVIKAQDWKAVADELAERVPHYRNPKGTANYYHMLGAAGKVGFAEITDNNIVEVVLALEEYAAANTEPVAA